MPTASPSSSHCCCACGRQFFKPRIHRLKQILRSPCSSCLLDPIPTSLLKRISGVLAEPISRIINLSLQSSIFPEQLKTAIITSLLKKPTLDPGLFSNFRPVSNTPFVAKLTKRHVSGQLSKLFHLMIFFILANLLIARVTLPRPLYWTC